MRNIVDGRLIFISFFILVCLATYLLITNTDVEDRFSIHTGGEPGERFYSYDKAKFNLLDPETAPETKIAEIMFGYKLVINTRLNAPEYVGNDLDCKNCHFNGGNLLGGKNRGISLVGVTAEYPHYSRRVKRVVTLPERINMCFTKSMNGKPLPYDSIEMESILAYLSWISFEVEDLPERPWLGLPVIKSKHVPDVANGEKVYAKYCSLCHGTKGEGSLGVPPVWGPGAYNSRAGLNLQSKLSSFVLLNMPYTQPTLTPEEAIDVAAYIIKQPRPK